MDFPSVVKVGRLLTATGRAVVARRPKVGHNFALDSVVAATDSTVFVVVEMGCSGTVAVSAGREAVVLAVRSPSERLKDLGNYSADFAEVVLAVRLSRKDSTSYLRFAILVVSMLAEQARTQISAVDPVSPPTDYPHPSSPPASSSR